MAKSKHQIGSELSEQLNESPEGKLRLPYAEFRKRFGIARRNTVFLNNLRRLLSSDYGVFLNPEVNGRIKRGSEHAWSSFRDNSTHVICRLRGATQTVRNGPKQIVADPEQWLSDENVMQIVAARGKNPRRLYEHQKKAINSMSAKMKAGFAGVLVIPTGGGKTRAAVHWLLSEVVDKGDKVLWLAHRHSLIDQACNAFCQTAFRGDALRAKDRFVCRKVSGRHARPIDIKADDDVVIGSVFSLGRSTGPEFLRDNWLSDDRSIVLVVDEAHHAPAPTYRKVIDSVRSRRPNVRLLGLTATPYRTAKREQGLMKKLFPGDVIHSVDLQELIVKDILAEPHFEDVQTNVNFGLDDKALDTLIQTGGNFGKLGERTCRTLGRNRERNRLIVDRYVKNKDRYGRTIVFALNIDNAIALSKLFNERGVSADYVVSSLHDADRKIRIDAEHNKETIEKFRSGRLEVVVNVNILTEGFDDPKVQTVFLARPTMSTIMMMQMVGRALRGRKANGTRTANIVSFIDDWSNKIRWESPRELVAREEASFAEKPDARQKAALKLISIRLMEEYAIFLDSHLGEDVFGDLPFTQRIPVGVYIVSMFDDTAKAGKADEDPSAFDQRAAILVFEHAKKCFDKFLKDVKPDQVPNPATKKFDQFVDRMMQKHFGDIAGLPFSPRFREIQMMLYHIAGHGVHPKYLGFNKREDYDIDKIAGHIYEQDMGDRAKMHHLKHLWDGNALGWRTFFGEDFPSFAKTVQDAVDVLARGPYQEDSSPKAILGKKSVEDCSMAELFEKHPKRWSEIREAVYSGAYDRRRKRYRCAATGWESTKRNEFQIDHIKPRSVGGKTILENLRLLRRRENAKKGAKWEE